MEVSSTVLFCCVSIQESEHFNTKLALQSKGFVSVHFSKSPSVLPDTSSHYDNTNHNKLVNIWKRLWKGNMWPGRFLRDFINLFSEQADVQGLGVSLLCEAESYVSTFTVKMWAGFMPQWWDVFKMLQFHSWMRWNNVNLDMACCRQVLTIPRRPLGGADLPLGEMWC